MIVTELQEAGSEAINTLVATAKNIVPSETLLSELASAILNLIRLKRVYFARVKYSNFASRYFSIDQDETMVIIAYLNSCSWEEWDLHERYGPCLDIEVCTETES